MDKYEQLPKGLFEVRNHNDMIDDRISKLTTSEDLEALKVGLHEASTDMGEIKNLGTLGSLGVPFDGNLGPQPMLESGAISQADVEQHLNVVKAAYVPAASNGTSRCVDGRGEEGYDDGNSESFAKPLGPQNAGGTVGFALSHAVSEFALGRNISFEEAYILASNNTRQLGFQPGNHDAVSASGEKSGCGAWDGRETTVEAIIENPDETRRLVESFYDATSLPFDPKVFDSMVSGFRKIWEQADYFPGLGQFKQALLTQNSEAFEHKAGDHSETDVIENMVAGTTMHTSHLDALTDGKVQSFGDDGWHRLDQANLYEDPQQKSLFLMAHVAFTMHTLKNLAHPSMELRARLPKAQQS